MRPLTTCMIMAQATLSASSLVSPSAYTLTRTMHMLHIEACCVQSMHMLHIIACLMHMLLFACCHLSDAVYQLYAGLDTDVWRDSGFGQGTCHRSEQAMTAMLMCV